MTIHILQHKTLTQTSLHLPQKELTLMRLDFERLSSYSWPQWYIDSYLSTLTS